MLATEFHHDEQRQTPWTQKAPGRLFLQRLASQETHTWLAAPQSAHQHDDRQAPILQASHPLG